MALALAVETFAPALTPTQGRPMVTIEGEKGKPGKTPARKARTAGKPRNPLAAAEELRTEPSDPAALEAWREWVAREGRSHPPERLARLAAFAWPNPPRSMHYAVLAAAFMFNDEQEARDAAEREAAAQRPAREAARAAERAAQLAAEKARREDERRERLARIAKAAASESPLCRRVVEHLTAIGLHHGGTIGSCQARRAALEVVRCVVHYVPDARARHDLYGAIGLAEDYLETFAHAPDDELAARAAECLGVIDALSFCEPAPRELVHAFEGALHGCDWRTFMHCVLVAGELLGLRGADELVAATLGIEDAGKSEATAAATAMASVD